MASLKYGLLKPLGCPTVEVGVAASQFFYHNGVNAVYLDNSGHATLALTATGTIFGIAIVPNGMGAGTSADYWKSSATAGADKIHVITTLENATFLLPADDTVTVAMIGEDCDMIAVNDGSATTVDVGTSSTNVFLIQDLGINFGGSTTDVVVKINPAKVQIATS